MQSAEQIEWVDYFYVRDISCKHVHPAVWFAFMFVSIILMHK